MDVWAGDIEVHGGTPIQGVELVATRPVGASFDNVSLRFLALVDLTRIPLYLALGPPLDVFSQHDATLDWFSAVLLNSHVRDSAAAEPHPPWWINSASQSPFGILTEVTKADDKILGPKITEILFYASSSVHAPDSALQGLPSPGKDDQLPETAALKIHALALSSELLCRAPAVATPPLSPQLPTFQSHEETAEFLPPLFDLPEAANARKRQSVSSLFDEAAERRKRARRKGGESIAAAASKVNAPGLPVQHKRSASSYGLQELFDPQNHMKDASSRPGSSDSGKHGRTLSRSPSLSFETQPASRKSHLVEPAKRSSLSRMTSATAADEEPTVESRNKDMISRLVMAGMRMYGLQQRKKASRPRKGSVATDTSAQAGEDASPEDLARDEEYKLVYHQAYKGTVFAMRNHIASTPLALRIEHLRETVDKLLAIFCTDPLAAPVVEVAAAAPSSSGAVMTPGPKQQPFGTPSHGFEHSPFDQRKTDYFGGAASLNAVHTPVTRRNAGQGG